MKFNFPGLSDKAVAESRETYGANVVTTQESENFLDKLLKNMKDPIIVILIVFQTNWHSTFSCSSASIITCTLTLMQAWDDS